MSDIEKRARELLAAEYNDDPMMQQKVMAGTCRNEELVRAERAIIAALTPPEGHVCRAELRYAQDAAFLDGVFKGIGGIPEGYVLVPVELPDMGGAPNFTEGNYSRSNWHAAIADLQWLAARPEVPNVNY